MRSRRTHPKVTVYITNHNYGRFLAKAIDSVLAQTLRDFELLVLDDGSTDGSREVLARYRGRDDRLRIVLQGNAGLNRTCARAVALARGRYVVRLDADDYLAPRALEVLAGVLDRDRDVALVYPDYHRISEDGEVLETVRLNDVGGPSALLDMPAHGACTMIRRDALLSVGSYDPTRRCQDGYDLWLKITARYEVRNVNRPLFYYRRHALSLSGDLASILRERRAIKDAAFRERCGARRLEVLALVPARGRLAVRGMTPLTRVAGRPLVDHTLDAARGSRLVTRVVVSTDDAALRRHVRARGVEVLDRPAALSGDGARIEAVVEHALMTLESVDGYRPDYVALLYVTNPLRQGVHIDEAVQTAVLFRVPSVVSLCEDPRLHYQHRGGGMVPLFERRLLKKEREALFEENGAVVLSAREAITPERFVAQPLGHILLAREEGVSLQSDYDRRVIEMLLKGGRRTSTHAALGVRSARGGAR